MVLTEFIKLQVARNHLVKLLQKSLSRSSTCLASSQIQCHRCDQRRSLSDSNQQHVPEWSRSFHLKEPVLNMKYLCDPEHTETINNNIVNRKGVGDIHHVMALWKEYNNETEASRKAVIWKQLVAAAKDIPNQSHPESPVGDEDNAKLVELVGSKKDFDYQPKTVVELGERLGMLRTDNVSMTTGERTYYFKHDLAKLEQALVQFTLDTIKEKGFELVTVPDMIHPAIIESCGFKTSGERTQVYKLDQQNHGDVCLAGTSEMPLAAYFMNEELNESELPVKLTAVSRCYRAETSELQEEKGIYRVHQFTKVEMFGVSRNSIESEEMMEEFLKLQMQLFSQLGLHFRVLDMPTQELGAPAYRKYDIETWMPAKQFWGEISSTSNCTDYQSRRLHITFTDHAGNLQYAHTVNGTACAVPRMIMALLENNQSKDGSVQIPDALQPYMKCEVIRKADQDLQYKWIKIKKIKARQ